MPELPLMLQAIPLIFCLIEDQFSILCKNNLNYAYYNHGKSLGTIVIMEIVVLMARWLRWPIWKGRSNATANRRWTERSMVHLDTGGIL